LALVAVAGALALFAGALTLVAIGAALGVAAVAITARALGLTALGPLWRLPGVLLRAALAAPIALALSILRGLTLRAIASALAWTVHIALGLALAAFTTWCLRLAALAAHAGAAGTRGAAPSAAGPARGRCRA